MHVSIECLIIGKHCFLCRIKKPQPDNREFIQQNGAPENCLAVLNNFYNDGVHWHDVACHHRKPFVCEESESLLKYVRFTNPNLRI
jgi:hypothetical protein